MKRRGTQKQAIVVAALLCGGFLLPILAGLWQTVLPAFGYLPAIGATNVNLDAWRNLFSTPGFGTSVGVTVFVGFSATFLALVAAIAFHAHPRVRSWTRFDSLFATPLLASPHAAIAIGLAFLIAPSGWLFRLVSPELSGLSVPPDVTIVNDAAGLALIFGLVVKETPFLILVIGAALNQLPHQFYRASARSLGYGPGAAWVLVVFPQIYPQIRLAVYAVLAFSLSVVDVSVILGPGTPPTIAVQTLRWYSAADSEMLLTASASAVFLTALVIGAILLWWLAERVIVFSSTWLLACGARHHWLNFVAKAHSAFGSVMLLTGGLSLVGLLVWSMTWRWNFPFALPESWSLAIWSRSMGDWSSAFMATLWIAVSSSLASLVAAIAVLETLDRSGRKGMRALTIFIYLPLILPQAAFIFGLHVAFLQSDLAGTMPAVAWSHMLFVFPYIMLALTDPWLALDPRFARAAASLGHTPKQILLHVKLPIMMRPVLTAFAIGFAVSVAQYLPTLVIGEGRIDTLTTEAVALSSGGDRRVIGVFGTLQALLPLVVYIIARTVPAFVFAKKKGMAGARA
ncbi:ABC transporter permease [Rhizobium sp. C1]|nr:ABC transporter permease subunit [Rhizobium sp. C1]MCD2179342.1 ABC transporter permease subunit [Rhizobium sp. C1]